MNKNHILTYSLVGVAVILALFASGLFTSLGDHEPFCLFYPTFGSSLKTTNMTVNFNEYQGKWYEVARKPNSFQSGCKCAIANYKFNATAKTVDVVNECIRSDGDQKKAHAIAKPLVKNDTSKLGVKFDGSFFTGSYFILDLDAGYNYALIGEPCHKYLWVLSRTPTLSKSKINELLAKAQKLGYETNDIMYRDGFCQG